MTTLTLNTLCSCSLPLCPQERICRRRHPGFVNLGLPANEPFDNPSWKTLVRGETTGPDSLANHLPCIIKIVGDEHRGG